MSDKPEFDPSKPYAPVSNEKPEFDPNKPFEPVQAKALPPKVGYAESTLNNATTIPALGLKDQFIPGAASLVLSAAKNSSAVRSVLANTLGRLNSSFDISPSVAEHIKSIPANYDAMQKTLRERTAAGDEQHPSTPYVGNAIGLGLTLGAGLPSIAASGPGLLARTAASAGTGMAYGGLGELGNAADDLGNGEFSKAGNRIVGGVEGGGLLGAALPLAGALVKKAVPATANWLEEKGINFGRRVLTNGADSLSTRTPVRESAVKEAINSGAIKPFSTTPATYERLQALTEEQSNRYRQILTELEQAGVKGPKAQELADTLLARASEIEPGEMNQSIPRLYRSQAETIAGKAPAGDNLGLTQTESLKRSLQRDAKYGRWDETPVNEARRDIASIARQANENAIEEQKALAPGPAASFVPVKQKLGNLLEAEHAAERGASRGAQRSALSLTDMLMAAGGAASGSGHGLAKGAAMAAVNNQLRNRGRSAVAVYGTSLADALRNASPNASSATPYTALLADILRNGNNQ